MAAMTMTFEVPETKLIDKESLRGKLKETLLVLYLTRKLMKQSSLCKIPR